MAKEFLKLESDQMAEGGPPPANVKPKKRRGCLWSFLITLLALLVLVAGCGAGTYLFGRNYLNRQLPVWEERYPILRLSMGFFRLRNDIRDIFKHFGSELERQEGVDDITLLPSDISLYPHPLLETCSIDKDQGVVFQRIEKPPDEVLSYLQESMQQNGWELEYRHEFSDGQILFWRREERTCKAEVLTHDGGSEIWLRYTETGLNRSPEI